MSSKSRKSLSTWYTCEKCKSVMLEKDAHKHVKCPSTECGSFETAESWTYPFHYMNIFHSAISRVEECELLDEVSAARYDDAVFLSKSVMDLCGIEAGSLCLLVTTEVLSVKIAYPVEDQSLTSVCLPKRADDKDHLYGLVKVKCIPSYVIISPAQEIVMIPVGNHGVSNAENDFQDRIKFSNEFKIFVIGNLSYVYHIGKKLLYKIIDINSEKNKIRKKISINDYPGEDILNPVVAFKNIRFIDNYPIFFRATYSTNYKILDSEKDKIAKSMYSIKDIGGYDYLISNIRRVIEIGIGNYKNFENFNITKGIILHGHPGVGKSMIASAILSASGVAVFSMHSSDIYSKSVNETEDNIKQLFDKAMLYSPSVILLEDIENLCPNRSNFGSDHERRVFSQLITFFDDMQINQNNVVLMATTSKLDSVNSSLRRPGRFGIEFEVCVPTSDIRTEILRKLLEKIPNTLTTIDVEEISSVTHGFVGADLHGLCSKAIFYAVQSEPDPYAKQMVSKDHFDKALHVTKPSAMNTVLVENPNVKWSDIGGQESLKQLLEQVLEWPREHSEEFRRLGIEPPKGVLMFGPPGCSKTMVAKAIATESSLNFLSIKGPELFSKWVGESEKAVREVFRKARQVAPAIVFIDEIDALGGERASSTGSGSNVQERVLAQLLTELDGITKRDDVMLLAATNRPDKMDKALLRPGRFDRIIYVGLPDESTREEIFKLKFQKMSVEENINIDELVKLTDGYTCAELEAICNEAGIVAIQEGLSAKTYIDVIKRSHFHRALKQLHPRTPRSLIQIYDNYCKENISYRGLNC
nr:PREDICTED: spermatogenesis-associated protein 5 [Linepithema humile]